MCLLYDTFITYDFIHGKFNQWNNMAYENTYSHQQNCDSHAFCSVYCHINMTRHRLIQSKFIEMNFFWCGWPKNACKYLEKTHTLCLLWITLTIKWTNDIKMIIISCDTMYWNHIDSETKKKHQQHCARTRKKNNSELV